MSLRRILTGAGLTLGLATTFAAAAFAQQPTPQDGAQPQQKQWEGRGRHRGMGRKGGRGGILRLASRLNLSDAQQQQLRVIEERFQANIQPQREEMRRLHESGEMSANDEARAQALRAEMRQAMKGMREEMISVLTPEQRAQLEQLMKERKARRGERHGRMASQNNDDDQ